MTTTTSVPSAVDHAPEPPRPHPSPRPTAGSALQAREDRVRLIQLIMFTAGGVLMPFGILAARATTASHALAYIGVVLFGFQMWISNVQTLPSDFFADASVGSVAGMGGTAAGISSLIFNLCTAWLVSHFGYGIVLTLAGLLAPIGALTFFALSGKIHRITLPESSGLPTHN